MSDAPPGFAEPGAETYRFAQGIKREELFPGNARNLAVERVGSEIYGGDGGVFRHFSVPPAGLSIQLHA